MSSSFHNLLKTQDSLQPIFQNENRDSVTNYHRHAEDGKQIVSNLGLGRLTDDSSEDVCFHDFQIGGGFHKSDHQLSPFNHEAGSTTERRASSTTILKHCPAMHSIAIPDMSLTELKTVTELSVHEPSETDGTPGEYCSSASGSGIPKRESIVSSASSHQVNMTSSPRNKGVRLSTARHRPLRSSSAQCPSVKKTASPNRKGRGSYVCTKPKTNKRNQRR